jgi:hypothetical protein
MREHKAKNRKVPNLNPLQKAREVKRAENNKPGNNEEKVEDS